MISGNTSSQPLVSVLIPAYNCQNYIRQALESILEQDYTNLEILIADDCSTDSTRSIIDSYADPRIRTFHNDRNLGNLVTTNELFDKAKGDLVTFQDADDWSDPRRIGEQVEILRKNPSVGICSTGFARVTENGSLLFNIKPLITHEEILDDISEEHHPKMCYASILAHRKAIQQAGGIYRVYFQGIRGADIDFFYRLLDNNRVQNIDMIRYFYRTVEQSITNDVDLNRFLPLLVGPQMSYFLLEQRREKGCDAVQVNDFTELERIKAYIIKKYENNTHKIYSTLAPRWASFKQRDKLIVMTKQYIAHHPLTPLTYVNIAIAFIRLLLGEEKYWNLSSNLTYVKKIYKTTTS